MDDGSMYASKGPQPLHPHAQDHQTSVSADPATEWPPKCDKISGQKQHWPDRCRPFTPGHLTAHDQL